MSLFQRIRTPFGESVPDDAAQPGPAPRAIGELLRERREELGLNLEEIGAALRIRPVYLAALEQGRAQDLPGPAYAIGFIRAYAQHLGFSGDRVLARYKAESAEIQTRPDLTLPVPLGERSLPGVPILLVGLILALCGYGTWYYLSTGERSRPERVAAVPAELRDAVQPTPPPAGAPAEASKLSTGLSVPQGEPPMADGNNGKATKPALVAETAKAAPAPTIATSAPPPAAAPAPLPASTPAPVATAASLPAGEAAKPAGEAATAATTPVIDIRATADCWIQVRAGDDQSIVFSRVLKAGETYHVPRAGLFLRTGNAGALAITVDGKPAPPIGRVGALRRNVALDARALLAGTAVHG